MNSTEEEEIVTVDTNWVASLEKRVSDTKFRDRNREPTIYRVPDILKKVDTQAYEPLLVSLGPYHHGKPHLQVMNQLKLKYLKFVLEKTPGVALAHYVDHIERLETRARDAYSEEVNMNSNSFVEMMLLDGCFVMLTIMEWNTKMKISEESTLWTRAEVLEDIFKLENQLPFFLLETLYKSAFPQGNETFRNLTFKFIRMHTSSNLQRPSNNETFHHIIHLFLSCIDPTTNHSDGKLVKGMPFIWMPSLPTAGFLCRFKLVFGSLKSNMFSVLVLQLYRTYNDQKAKAEDDLQLLEFPWIPTATVLNEAGIHFERKKKAKSFLDITFHKGKLQIPKLQIDGKTNSLLRNLIAYEQCSMGPNFHVSSYAKLMDYIINTAEDVELLQKDEIVISDLGDSQVVATLFNKLPMHIVVQWRGTYFFDAINAMLKQRNTRCSKWRAVLNRDYFGNPWAVISLVGAFFLFVLTLMQAIYAVLSYARSRN